MAAGHAVPAEVGNDRGVASNASFVPRVFDEFLGQGTRGLMRIYLLRFTSRSALATAFARVADDTEVASCIIDSEDLRLRFAAPDTCADALVERIYADGGLSWSSRHDLQGMDGHFGSARPEAPA